MTGRRARPDLVEVEADGGFVSVKGVDVKPVAEVVDDGTGPSGGLLDAVAAALAEGLLCHPAHQRLHVLAGGGLIGGPADQVAA